MDQTKACVDLANKLILQCGLPQPRVSRVQDVSPQFFMLLFNKICNVHIPEIIPVPLTQDDEAHNVQAVIDTLSLDMLHISLSHITGVDIVARDPCAVYNLLEIFEACLSLNLLSTTENVRLKSSDSGSTSTAPEVEDSDDSVSLATEEAIALGNSLCKKDKNESFVSSSDSCDSCPICEYLRMKRISRPDLEKEEQQFRMSSFYRRDTLRDVFQNEKGSSSSEALIIPSEERSSSTDDLEFEDLQRDQTDWDGAQQRMPVRRTEVKHHPYQPQIPPESSTKRKEKEEERSDENADPNVELQRLIQLNSQQGLSRNKISKTKPQKDYKKSVLIKQDLQKRKKELAKKDQMARVTAYEQIGISDSPETSLSPHTRRLFERKYQQHVRMMTSAYRDCDPADVRIQRQYDAAIRKHFAHVNRLKKDIGHAHKMREMNTQKQLHYTINALNEDRKGLHARLKKHQEDHERIMKSRTLSRKHAEEMVLRNLFQESLDVQRKEMQEIRTMAREKQLREEDRHRVHLAALENFYQTQLAAVSESLTQEKIQVEHRISAQSKVLGRLRQEFRRKLESETRGLYDHLENKDDDRFRAEQKYHSMRSLNLP